MIIRRRDTEVSSKRWKVTYRFGRSVFAWSCFSHRSFIVGFLQREMQFLSMDKWAVVEGLGDEDRRAKVLSDREKDFQEHDFGTP